MSKVVSKYLFRSFSLLAAILLWFYVLNAEPIVMNKKIPIRFVVPLGKAIANIVPKEITVKISGSRTFVTNAFFGESVIVNLKELHKGRDIFQVPISGEMMPQSFGIKVVSFSPNILDIELDRKIKKEVPVKPQFFGELDSDYNLVYSSIIPNKLMIEGPISVMRKISVIQSEIIDLSRLKGKGGYRVNIDDVDPRVKIDYSDDYQFEYEIRATKGNSTISDVPIRFISSRLGIKSKISSVSVSVLTTESVKKSLRKNDIKILADIPEARTGWLRVKLKAELPENVHLLKIEPEQITIHVK